MKNKRSSRRAEKITILQYFKKRPGKSIEATQIKLSKQAENIRYNFVRKLCEDWPTQFRCLKIAGKKTKFQYVGNDIDNVIQYYGERKEYGVLGPLRKLVFKKEKTDQKSKSKLGVATRSEMRLEQELEYKESLEPYISSYSKNSMFDIED
jgi:hypothetical protein